MNDQTYGKLIKFNGTTVGPISPNKVLDGAKNKLVSVLVIGFENDTNNLYIASSDGDAERMVFLTELAKKEILFSAIGDLL